MRGLVWAGVCGLLLRRMADQRVVDLDVFHEMALFREALARGALPTHDPFAYTPTWTPVVHHEWGTGAVLYAVWEGLHLGPLGLGLLRLVLLAALAAVCWRAARRAGATLASVCVAAPAALFLIGWGLSPVRAHLFTYLFVAVLLLLLDRDRGGDRRWIAPWLVAWVLWVNLHGGFVVGLGLVGAAALERLVVAWRTSGAGPAVRSVAHLALVGAAMSVLALVNPWGVAYLEYLARALAMPRPGIAEWAPLWSPAADPTLVLVFALSVVVLAYAVAQRGGARMPGLAAVGLLALASMRSQRHLPLYAVAWFVVVAPALAATNVGATLEAVWARRRTAIAAALALCAAGGGWSFASKRGWELRIPNDADGARLAYPVRAVDWLSARGFTGHVLTSFEDGAYVAWRLHPAAKVSLDSRYEAAYRDGLFEAHRAFYAAQPGWEAFLGRYATDASVLPCAYPVVRRLDTQPGWTRAYDDGSFCVHLHATASTASVAR